MEIAKLVLEYAKILLSTQIVAGGTAVIVALLFRVEIRSLIGRIAQLKFGGGEIFTSQQMQTQAEKAIPAGTSPLGSTEPDVQLPPGVSLAPAEAERIAQLLRSARSTAHLWEYRFLNLFLVRSTQAVLTWLAGPTARPRCTVRR